MAELHNPKAVLNVLSDVRKTVASMLTAVHAAKRTEEAMIANHEHPDDIEIGMQRLYDALDDMRDHAVDNIGNINLTTYPPFIRAGFHNDVKGFTITNNTTPTADTIALVLWGGTSDANFTALDASDAVRISGTGTDADGRHVIQSKTGQTTLTFSDGSFDDMDSGATTITKGMIRVEER